jgi:hypothetical protein
MSIYKEYDAALAAYERSPTNSNAAWLHAAERRMQMLKVAEEKRRK